MRKIDEKQINQVKLKVLMGTNAILNCCSRATEKIKHNMSHDDQMDVLLEIKNIINFSELLDHQINYNL